MRSSTAHIVFALMLTLLVIALVPGVGLGADAHDAAAKKDGGIFEIFIDLGIWTILVFLLLLVILRVFAWGPILEGLKQRETDIQSAIDDARKDREEAAKERARLKEELDKASEKVREILEEARRDAQATTEEMVSKARAEIQTERDRLRREIKVAEDQALQEIWSQSVQLATAISSKTIERQLTADDHRKYVDEAVADLHRLRQGAQKA